MKVFSYPHKARDRWLNTPVGSAAYKPWLTDGGSLTRRLQLRCQHFSVRPVRVQEARPHLSEARLLRCLSRRKAWLRDVHLQCEGRAVVFAHSVLPHAVMQGAWRGLVTLGNRSLGSTLFSDPTIRRVPLQYKKLGPHHFLYRQAAAGLDGLPKVLWARRSVFTLKCSAILVTEIFLPAVLHLEMQQGDT
ncbi:chorismate lyase [Methylobacillus gramineus]|uniref:chorismate--pyruvate lyase family protein n=1 Tax=Methylobacillus gramineus TaxID=755169 RepID=UPI001CFF79CD|nr:chorismate lyase [Methylobacillus gramineus]MCB5185660.1 chorismate lyase [Methylobacillus gramineus]